MWSGGLYYHVIDTGTRTKRTLDTAKMKRRIEIIDIFTKMIKLCADKPLTLDYILLLQPPIHLPLTHSHITSRCGNCMDQAQRISGPRRLFAAMVGTGDLVRIGVGDLVRISARGGSE